jgi:hypothetical protein
MYYEIVRNSGEQDDFTGFVTVSPKLGWNGYRISSLQSVRNLLKY